MQRPFKDPAIFFLKILLLANFARTRQKNQFASAGAPRTSACPQQAGPPEMHGIINTTNHIISYQFLEGGRT